MDVTDLLTTAEAARILRKRPRTLYSWSKLENPPLRPFTLTVNGKRQLRWSRQELDQLYDRVECREEVEEPEEVDTKEKGAASS